MVRYTLLVLFIAWVGTVSTRDWFKALCFALPLIAFLERPDMPRAMFGLPGLNPFNIILLFVLIGWLAQKGRDG
ncbi:MAG: O-antigen ligase family protein, partial [Pseudomonadota bacterium]